MRELIRQKEEQSQKATRYLKPLKDEVLSGSGNFILLLEFSAPVTTDSVVLGGKRIDGKSKGNTWSGSFNLTGMQGDNQAKLIVAAKGTTTQKELDDPVTEAKYRSSNQRWTGYERTTDRYHKIKLKALRSGTSILLLVDCSGSMGDNGRMAKAKAAAEKVLSSAQFEPTDEVALMAFYDCGDVRVLQAFTNDLAEVKTKLNLLSPSGYTPLSSSIIAASYYLESTARTPYRKMIVLTDGQESCNGNEFETMQRIKKFHQDIKKIIL
jgi:Mg-chelatase subunit ChlD